MCIRDRLRFLKVLQKFCQRTFSLCTAHHHQRWRVVLTRRDVVLANSVFWDYLTPYPYTFSRSGQLPRLLLFSSFTAHLMSSLTRRSFILLSYLQTFKVFEYIRVSSIWTSYPLSLSLSLSVSFSLSLRLSLWNKNNSTLVGHSLSYDQIFLSMFLLSNFYCRIAL